MDIYKVKSGELNVKIESRTPQLAAIKAIDIHQPVALEKLIGVLKEGDSEEEELYILTDKILESMGYEVTQI